MKIELYMDVYSWTTPDNFISATTKPADRTGGVRYKLIVEVPDPQDPDVIIEVTPTKVEDETG